MASSKESWSRFQAPHPIRIPTRGSRPNPKPGPRQPPIPPVAFDGLWIDYYLRRFTSYGLTQGPYESDVLFPGGGMCIRSYAAAITRRPVTEISPPTLPAEWFGDIEHTHRAIDDARGYANLLTYLLGQGAG